ncbi:hypothetical protein G8C92_06520 [Paenibacillus donghaensis]|uniref:hypothetical protein n=1 Tax=Paenibacillus donghaensis TaxID=414771 RepID=UPI001883D6E9|nr:hypothetical protein [Paenibacillus donghaensis]MBE9913684.1 hypothetical protein [Paenibacillus donghaensis]
MDEKTTAINELSKEREGYIMRNDATGIEIKCTEKFLKHWEKRGFTIVKEGLVHFLEEEPGGDF